MISIIIPAHNEAARIANTLRKISIDLRGYNYEVIVVANGCTDDTAAIVRDYMVLVSRKVFMINLPERGKGLAVRTGMLMARGEFLYMCDADLSTPIIDIFRFQATSIHDQADVVIGSRELATAHVVTTPTRRLIGRVFNVLAGVLVPGIPDTQCGFKLFTRSAAEKIFGACQINGMAFDVEALYLARLYNMRITQMPVRWTHNPDSRVRMLPDSTQMALDLLRIPALHASRIAQVKRAIRIFMWNKH